MQDNRAYYNPARDWVVVPSRAQFSTRAEYYGVVMHELAHATGHPDRLNRGPLTGDHTSPSYAREELRAEIASMMVCTQLGLGHFPKNNVAYVASWVRGLRDDPMEIRKATQDASQMAGYLLRGMGREKRMDLTWQPPAQDRGLDTSSARSPLSPFEGLELSHPIMIGGHSTAVHHAARSHEMGLSR